MGYVFNFVDTIAYDAWNADRSNLFISDLEVKLFLDLLNPYHGNSILDIGCGTGLSISPLLDKGLDITGIDPSPYMLDIAEQKFKNKVNLCRGFAEDLPFDDNHFNYASFFTSLEFTENPKKALEEACRVTKDKIFLGVLNSYSVTGIKRRVTGVFKNSIYNKACFYSIWELKSLIKEILGDVPIQWKTTSHFTMGSERYNTKIENLKIMQKSPFGCFIGMTVRPVPRFRTRPLSLKFHSNKKNSTVTSYASNVDLKTKI